MRLAVTCILHRTLNRRRDITNVQQTNSSLREYLHALRRRWKWMAGAVLAAVVVAAAVSYTTIPIYESTAQLTFVRQPDIASALSGGSSFFSIAEAQVQVQTYAELMTSGEMRRRAEREYGAAIPADVDVSAEYVPDTSVLRISARSPQPAEAQAVANAYANAFTDWRRQATVLQYKEAERIIEDRIARYGDDPNRISDPAYVQLVGQLQDVRLLQSAATGNFVIAAPAELPTEPVLPQHTRDVMVGLLIGLVLGIFAVTLLEQLDVRIHSVEEIGEALGLPVLGRFPRLTKDAAARDDLTAVTEPSGPVSEAFRMHRGNLDFVNVDGNVTSVVISSCSQGEGKTTTASNLGVTLARGGKRVILVDCDLRRPRLHRFMGVSNRVGLSTVVAGKTALVDGLQAVELAPQEGVAGPAFAEWAEGSDAHSRLYVLPSGPLPPNPGEIVASRRMAEVIAELSEAADLVLIDAPPFLVVGDTAALARVAGGIIVVSRLGTVTKAMLKEATEALAPLPCRKLGVVVTDIPIEGTAYRYRYYRDAAAAEPETAESDPVPVSWSSLEAP